MFSPVTLLIVAIMSSVVSMAVFGSLLHAEIPGLPRWIGANAVIAIALVLLALQAPTPAQVVIVAASGLLGAAALMMLQGCREFFGLRPSRSLEYVAYGALLLGIVYWGYISPNANARIALLSAFLAYVRLVIGWIAFSLRPAGRPRYCYQFMSGAAFLGAAVHASRSIACAMGWEHQAAFLEPTPLNIAFLVLGILALPCLSIGVLMLAHDRMAERMERLANVDGLTGALVRRAFLVRAESLLHEAKSSKLRLSIAILDLDKFKAINDEHGHAGGDQVLAHFAFTVSSGLRCGDIFGRLGGEEFAVLSLSTGRADTVRLMDQLRVRVAAARLTIPSGEVAYTFSAGVDEYREGDTLANMMGRADAALYAAKAMGRDCVVGTLLSGSQRVEDGQGESTTEQTSGPA
ncbi:MULTISPECIES: GGDEF domain-containing protein [Paraburkholderia]|uniref:GGDEF domain-containing protein n=1 Tax=Paraburkholderia TaxID=1822464 RepID=UPI00224F8F1B|nr:MULTISPECIES: GGDEF domain-containing protein [Paraburkholderia]MCX4175938.1 GGDEF domain-containing protein [Paraburkholderia madseniana]MDQ6463932.1 GGDEF domain-containing protein [Paraburkholderia madseniana]